MAMKKNNQKGVALLLTLLIMAAIVAIAIGVSRLSLGEIKISREEPRSLVAYYAAESGVEWAMYADRNQGGTSGGDACLDATSEVCYHVEVMGTTPNRTIRSSGSYKGVIRSIELTY